MLPVPRVREAGRALPAPCIKVHGVEEEVINGDRHPKLVGTPALQLGRGVPLAAARAYPGVGSERRRLRFAFAASIALAVDAGFWLSSACCESLCFRSCRLRRSQSAKVEKNSNKAEGGNPQSDLGERTMGA